MPAAVKAMRTVKCMSSDARGSLLAYVQSLCGHTQLIIFLGAFLPPVVFFSTTTATRGKRTPSHTPTTISTSNFALSHRTVNMSTTLAYLEKLTSRRRFVPSEIWGDELDLDKFEDYEWSPVWVVAPSEEKGRCRCCDQHISFGDAFIIAVDGACRGNGGANAQAACGIFCNVNSVVNNAFVLDESMPTSQRAELHAAISALETLRTIHNTTHDRKFTDEVIIKRDSAYLVNSMTSYVNKWRANEYLSAKGKSVVNQDLLKKLDGLVFDLADEAGLRVRFWHVLRERNRPADVLANAALDGEDWKSFGAAQLFAGGPKPYVRPCDDREETAETL
jgi:ribonuclease HI